MTVRKAGKGIVRSGGGTYQIGYTDLYGMEQETELSSIRDEGSGRIVEFLVPGI